MRNVKPVESRAKDLFPGLPERNREARERYGLKAGGHDFDHDAAVAHFVWIIAEDEETRFLGVAAAWCHSADHMLEKRLGVPHAPKEETENLVRWMLEAVPELTPEEKERVVHVVLHHKGRNQDTDTPLQVALNDADRLADMLTTLLVRSGQFHPDLPVVDPVHWENDPKASYYEPGATFWDTNNCRKWADETGPYILRLPKAREFGKALAAFLGLYMEVTKLQYKMMGLDPYPY